MVARVHISHSFDDYSNPSYESKLGYVDSAQNFLKKIEKSTVLFSAIKCEMKWAERISPNEFFYIALKGGVKELKQLTSPLVFSTAIKASYKLFLNAVGLKHARKSDPDNLKNSKKIHKAEEKLFLSAAKWVGAACKTINLLNEMHLVEPEKWGKYMPEMLGNTAFVTSAISSCASFKNAYFKFGKEKDNDAVANLVRSGLGLTSTFFSGAGFYFSIFVPPVVSQGLSTVSVMISISQHFNERDRESKYFHSRFVHIK